MQIFGIVYRQILESALSMPRPKRGKPFTLPLSCTTIAYIVCIAFCLSFSACSNIRRLVKPACKLSKFNYIEGNIDEKMIANPDESTALHISVIESALKSARTSTKIKGDTNKVADCDCQLEHVAYAKALLAYYEANPPAAK